MTTVGNHTAPTITELLCYNDCASPTKERLTELVPLQHFGKKKNK